MIQGIGNIVFNISNLAGSCDFFENKLGLKIVYKDEEAHYAEVDLGDVYLGLQVKEPAGGGGNPVLSLTVDDLNKTIEELKGKGVEFEGEIKEEDYGKIITVKDPDGNTFILVEQGD